MKGGRPSTQDERDYAFRRVLYNTMVAAQGISELVDDKETLSDDVYGTASDVEGFPRQEVAKIAALIMARNLDAFFFPDPNSNSYYKHSDDIYHTDFNFVSWSPNSKANISDDIKKRMHKIAGHIVADKQIPFKDSGKVKDIVIRLIREASRFTEECRRLKRAEWTGAAEMYRDELNKLLPELGIPVIPNE